MDTSLVFLRFDSSSNSAFLFSSFLFRRSSSLFTNSWLICSISAFIPIIICLFIYMNEYICTVSLPSIVFVTSYNFLSILSALLLWNSFFDDDGDDDDRRMIVVRTKFIQITDNGKLAYHEFGSISDGHIKVYTLPVMVGISLEPFLLYFPSSMFSLMDSNELEQQKLVIIVMNKTVGYVHLSMV